MAISYRAAQTLIKRKDAEALDAALAAGLDANAANQNGWTLLMLAAIEGAPETATVLLNAGANAAATNRNGETALSLAAERGHVDLLRTLLERGASKDIKPRGLTLADAISASQLGEPERLAVLEALGL